jgi:N-acetylneuraminic acid mutarotase
MCRTSRCFAPLLLAVFLLVVASFIPDSIVIFASPSASNLTMPKAALEAAGTWVPAGSLVDGRHEHTATLLSDGRVLIVGGLQERAAGSQGLASVEVYDPVSGTWSITGSLNSGRAEHTATLLPDGTVLVTGGNAGYSGPALASVEIYDPTRGTWSAAPPLSVPRRGHSATRLADGRVLVVGGRFSTNDPDVHASAEIYDPVSGTWSPTGSLLTPREGHSATLLPDSRVLVVGGYYQSWLASAEVYDAVSGAWREIAAPLACHGVAHTATLVSDGKVLIAGGACASGISGIRDDAEVYDPATSSWHATTALPAIREAHTATLLPDGTVLIAGGDTGAPPRYDSALIYDPAGRVWSPTGSLATGRRNHTATLIRDGTVLVVGGLGDTKAYLESAELYQGIVADIPTPVNTSTSTLLPPTPTSTPLPPTSTPVPPTNTPTSTRTSTPLPPTKEAFLGGNLNLVRISVLSSIICVAAIIGIVAVVGGIILYARSTRKR